MLTLQLHDGDTQALIPVLAPFVNAPASTISTTLPEKTFELQNGVAVPMTQDSRQLFLALQETVRKVARKQGTKISGTSQIDASLVTDLLTLTKQLRETGPALTALATASDPVSFVAENARQIQRELDRELGSEASQKRSVLAIGLITIGFVAIFTGTYFYTRRRM